MHSALLTDRITIVSIATDEYGHVTMSRATGVYAHVSEKNRFVMGLQGKEVTSSLQIIVKATENVKHESKIIIESICGSAYFTTKEWQIIQISIGHIFKKEFIEIWL